MVAVPAWRRVRRVGLGRNKVTAAAEWPQYSLTMRQETLIWQCVPWASVAARSMTSARPATSTTSSWSTWTAPTCARSCATGSCARAGAANRSANLRRLAVCPRGGGRPPRHQAGEHPAGPQGARENRRLWAGEAPGAALCRPGGFCLLRDPVYVPQVRARPGHEWLAPVVADSDWRREQEDVAECMTGDQSFSASNSSIFFCMTSWPLAPFQSSSPSQR